MQDLEKFSNTRKLPTVYQDFLKLSALSISNSIDKANFEPREQEYLTIISKYTKEEQELFPKMFASLVIEMETSLEKGTLKDILGSIYEELHMGSKTFQQYFTPEDVAEFMAKITVPREHHKETETLSDPTCGSGRLIYAYAQELHLQGINFQDKIKVQASDIDIDCVHMTYIQCSLYNIPAVICHENSLSKDLFATYKTPAFILKYERRSLLENLQKAKETSRVQEQPAETNRKNKDKNFDR